MKLINNNVETLLWAICIFIFFSTISAFVFALQAGVIAPTEWSKTLLSSLYGYQKGVVSTVDIAKILFTHVLFPVLISIAVGVIFYYVFRRIKKRYPKWFNRLFKLLISVKLAVVIIIIMGVVAAVGTFVEAKYDAKLASRLVYQSLYMHGVLGLLCVQLILVMVDRWPWKRHHLPFVLAHIGIVTTLYGSVLTKYFGVDGSIIFGIGQTQRHITHFTEDVMVYSSFDGSKYALLDQRRVDFFNSRPSRERPYSIPLGEKKIEVIEYQNYTIRNSKITSSLENAAPPAVRVQIEGSRARATKWLMPGRNKGVDKISLGPLELVFAKDVYLWDGKSNIILMTPSRQKAFIDYKVFSKSRQKLIASGKAKVGDVVDTGFMDFKLRIINYFLNASEVVTYEPREYPNDFTTPAVLVRFNEKESWVGLNSVVKFFTDSEVFIFSYANTRLNMGFDMTLNKFRVGRYQGTMKAMSYESDITIQGGQQATISMNDPFKQKGFTFYQASFEQDDSGKPVASILSVNRDPGRFLKYLGSFLIILGTIMLFYFKKAMIKVNRIKNEI